MRRLMVLLALFLAVTGTPFRLAEAAEDLARALSELGAGVGIEEVDGGVGDDSEAMLKADRSHAGDALACVDVLMPSSTLGDWAATQLLRRLIGPLERVTTDSSQRRSFLQCYLC